MVVNLVLVVHLAQSITKDVTPRPVIVSVRGMSLEETVTSVCQNSGVSQRGGTVANHVIVISVVRLIITATL